MNVAEIERHNSTHFTVTVSLAYTGGGAIHTIILENSNQAPIRIPASPSPDSNLVWTGDFSIPDTSLNPVDFMVSVLNEHGFDSKALPVVGKFMNQLMIQIVSVHSLFLNCSATIYNCHYRFHSRTRGHR